MKLLANVTYSLMTILFKPFWKNISITLDIRMEADKVTKPIHTSGEKQFMEKQFPFPFIFTSAKLSFKGT